MALLKFNSALTKFEKILVQNVSGLERPFLHSKEELKLSQRHMFPLNIFADSE